MTQNVEIQRVHGENVYPFFELLKQLLEYLTMENFQKAIPVLEAKGYCFLGLMVDELPVGFAQYHIESNLENYHYGVLDELIIDEKYRGQGLGTKLLEFVEQDIRSEGVQAMGLLSGIHRESAHEFYKKNGFEFRSKWFAKKFGE